MAKAVDSRTTTDVEHGGDKANAEPEQAHRKGHVAYWLLYIMILLLCGGMMAVVYCALDLTSYNSPAMPPDPVDLVRVNRSTAGTIRLYLDISFLHLPCDQISLDSVSHSGIIHLHQNDAMHKVDLDQNGGPNFGDCKTLKFGCKLPVGCRLSGALLVPDETGSLAVVPGTSLIQNGELHKEMRGTGYMDYNTSHIIHRLELGEAVHGKSWPLAGTTETATFSTCFYRYFITLTAAPEAKELYHYSAFMLEKILASDGLHGARKQLPGVTLAWQLPPPPTTTLPVLRGEQLSAKILEG